MQKWKTFELGKPETVPATSAVITPISLLVNKDSFELQRFMRDQGRWIWCRYLDDCIEYAVGRKWDNFCCLSCPYNKQPEHSFKFSDAEHALFDAIKCKILVLTALYRESYREYVRYKKELLDEEGDFSID